MIRIEPVIVTEGRYDKNKLMQIFDTAVIEVGGFGIFRDKKLLALLRRLAETRGLLVLTDPDGAGFVIRNHIKGAVTRGRVYHAYVPDIYGKERRKSAPSAEGKLGVEGLPDEVLIEAVRRSGVPMEQTEARTRGHITKALLYELGLSGGAGSRELRRRLCRRLALPERLGTNALPDVLSALLAPEELRKLTESLRDEQ